jgi:hypothetical protein
MPWAVAAVALRGWTHFEAGHEVLKAGKQEKERPMPIDEILDALKEMRNRLSRIKDSL